MQPLLRSLIGGLAVATALAGCAAPGASTTPAVTGATAEAAGQKPRLVLTYDGGLLVLDATTGEQVADLALSGFNRINAAGDGRHVMVSTAGGWAVLDAGSWSKAHGDHSHSYTTEPSLTQVLVEAEEPGHVVVHDGLTALFDDGTGTVTVAGADGWTDAAAAGTVAVVRSYTTASAHHGVAIAGKDGSLLVTRGDTTTRTGAALLDGSDTTVVQSDECPGVHGEAVADDAYQVVGCENGMLVFHEGAVSKISSPDAFGRIGNAFAVDGSTWVLGDYKTDAEGGIGLSSVSLTDVARGSMKVVPLSTRYTWRGLARGDEGEALVFGTDGVLRVLDPQTGAERRAISVTSAWTVPEEWQTAHPALTVLEGMAYITDPATNSLHIVDYSGGKVWKTVSVSQAPIELVGVTG
ncbi:hypothetical protein [Propionicicella superfundia]|uniref:hypothetical protein n=1 Tax=Propionicicella superfundia TaxID=348582 RepID=UPI0004059750|nr:hypothetical protein [Propionicicella superfundia]